MFEGCEHIVTQGDLNSYYWSYPHVNVPTQFRLFQPPCHCSYPFATNPYCWHYYVFLLINNMTGIEERTSIPDNNNQSVVKSNVLLPHVNLPC